MQLFDELLRRFGASLRGIQLYSAQHPLVARNIDGLWDTIRTLQAHEPSITLGIVGEELVVGDMPMPKATASMGELIRRLRGLGVERIGVERGVTRDEIAKFVQTLGTIDPPSVRKAAEESSDVLSQPHIRVGRALPPAATRSGPAASRFA